jgi:hypothetical protein
MRSIPVRWLTTFALAMLLGLPACAPEKEGPKKDRGHADKKELPPPCHPGCFPAGTLVATPGGPRPIESVRRGDVVTLLGKDGVAASGKVGSTFRTCNRLVEVRTDGGALLTTETQPLCLRDGGFRRAGELAEGDVVWRWEAGGRVPARVQAVEPAAGEAKVFNLVVGESAVFVAGGFLARGKPPLTEAE